MNFVGSQTFDPYHPLSHRQYLPPLASATRWPLGGRDGKEVQTCTPEWCLLQEDQLRQGGVGWGGHALSLLPETESLFYPYKRKQGKTREHPLTDSSKWNFLHMRPEEKDNPLNRYNLFIFIPHVSSYNIERSYQSVSLLTSCETYHEVG